MMKYFSGRKKFDGVQIVSTTLIIIFSLIVFVTFWNALVISFSTPRAASKYPFSWLPKEFTFDNYSALLMEDSSVLKNAYLTTIYMTIVGTLAGMTISVMAAYGFSRKFPGKRLFFTLVLITMFFGGGLVPTYLQYKNMGLLNVYGCIIISLVSVYNVIIMKSGFENVPMDLQEAAMIDGAHDIQVFFKIMLPLQKPLIATFTLFTIVSYWNSWYHPMLFMIRSNATTLQLYLKNVVAKVAPVKDTGAVALYENVFTEGAKMAAVFLVMTPVMVVYPFLQKYFTKGIMVGAVKM